MTTPTGDDAHLPIHGLTRRGPSLSSLPAVMYAAHTIGTVGFLTASGFILMVSWASQTAK